MASKKTPKISKYCRIFQWIEEKEPRLAYVIRELCLEGHLSPSGRFPGITFLYPKDEKYLDDIIDKFNSKPEEAEKIILSLIIPDALITGSDFTKNPIGSRLGIKYTVEKADSDKVMLA